MEWKFTELGNGRKVSGFCALHAAPEKGRVILPAQLSQAVKISLTLRLGT